MTKFCPFVHGKCDANCRFARSVPTLSFGSTTICAFDEMTTKLDLIIKHLKENHNGHA